MGSAQRYREFIADLESHCPRLSEAQMVGVSGASGADQTRLRCNELEMAFVAMPAWLADREHAFIDFGGGSVGSKMCRSRRIVRDGGFRRDRRGDRWFGRGFDLSRTPPWSQRFVR
jgi:hypothetical protein